MIIILLLTKIATPLRDTNEAWLFVPRVVGTATVSINEQTAKSIRFFNKGRTLFQDKDYKNALAAFEQAKENFYYPLKEPLFNIGVCYLQLNENEKACKHFLEAARYGDADAEKIYKERCKAKAAINKPSSDEPLITESENQPDQKGIYKNTEQHPEFPGGDSELIRFLSRNIRYPMLEVNQDVQGTVLTRFVINEDGTVSDIEIMKSVSIGLDKEAIRVVGLLPKFKPGYESKKPVKVYFNLPVTFRINN